MGRALRVHPGQESATWALPGLQLGILELAGREPVKHIYAPATDVSGRYSLWMAGEAFSGGGSLNVADAAFTRTFDFRCQLLEGLLEQGIESVAQLDGEYQIAIWDAHEMILTLLNDRFGGLPSYWSVNFQGFAFAGGVRGVLMAPGVSTDPDPAAILEAVSFGGFRLGDRTNVEGIKMLPGASIVTVQERAPTFRRYWHWSGIRPQKLQPLRDLIEDAHALWRKAIRLRVSDAARPGQTLSGGLDSRLILAEAAPQAPQWTAITYGLPGCDDTHYAQMAAEEMGVTWVSYFFREGGCPDWLDLRESYIQQTDGLIDLVDLCHLETLEVQQKLLDVHLSGYIGDAVIGPTFNEVSDAHGVLEKLPYYGLSIGYTHQEAFERAAGMIEGLVGAAPRFALFEHKLPQSTNRWTASWRPWFRVRKPFVDYAFFDFCQGLPACVRSKMGLYEHWLHTKYKPLFGRIPWQKTGLPILTPTWRIQVERAKRFAYRKAQPALKGLGFNLNPRRRGYQPDNTFWKAPDARARIEQTILRNDSLSCEIFGRNRVRSLLNDWFDRSAAPTQSLAAMYVYECYHRDLPSHLRHARMEQTALL